MTTFPLTLIHIGSDAPLPTTAQTNPRSRGPNNEYHNAGEVWCAALWEVFVNLVEKHGHETGADRMLKYVIGGLKLTPNNPTYTQARDGIIGAVNAQFPGDLMDLWAGFAKRGMGVGAQSPPSVSKTLRGVVESYDVPHDGALE